jgi:glutamate synthase domain-containing protein 2
MALYRCDICKAYVYDSVEGYSPDSIKPGTKPDDFPDDWECPICKSDKTHLIQEEEEKPEEQAAKHTVTCPVCGERIEISHIPIKPSEGYMGQWIREEDELEVHMAAIHKISETAEPITEPMRTTETVVPWGDILIKGAQLATIPLNPEEKVNAQTVIGPQAKVPLIMETPIYITHMSFGALSREVKIALAKGSAAVKTAMCSGEGGILPDVKAEAYKYIFEYVPNQYSVTDENLASVDGIEIKIGQSAKPGMGGLLPASKVTREIAEIRGLPEGTDIISPASFEDIRSKEDLKKKVLWLRDKSGGKPIGVKIAAGNIEDDLECALYAEPDFITIDGRPGGTAASHKFVKDSASVPTIFALHRAKTYLDKRGVKDITLCITGGLRISSDFAKALALGADAVAIGTAALMACACQQYRICNTDKCPTGVTTNDPALRSRLDIDISSRKLENFLRISTEEIRDFARLTGKNSLHKLTIRDLCTVNSEISNHTEIKHV